MPRYFYPRPPRGGRQLQRVGNVLCGHISIHALREEGDGEVCQHGGRKHPISIHALREEGDIILPSASPCWKKISIHALREEGDAPPTALAAPGAGISIHALREEGDLRFRVSPGAGSHISIHALREEGDAVQFVHLEDLQLFLSTPSARRATAKTERKHPAFVSLYTSLHKLQRDVCKPNRKITPLLAQTAGIPVRSVPENHVCCRFALAGHQKISTLSWANSGCSPTCSTLVW